MAFHGSFLAGPTDRTPGAVNKAAASRVSGGRCPAPPSDLTTKLTKNTKISASTV
jgi:hypothetical protein